MSRNGCWLRLLSEHPVDERLTIMNTDEIAEILAKPYAQQLLNGPEPARLAYNGLDGDPRVIPIGFWTEGGGS